MWQEFNSWMRATFLLLFLCSTLILFSIPFLVVAVLRLTIGFAWLDFALLNLMSALFNSWYALNTKLFLAINKVTVEVSLPEGLSKERSYLLIANHRSWVDVMLLIHSLRDKTPLIRFFVKASLFWLPFIGVVMKALQFPFVEKPNQSVTQDVKTQREETIKKALLKLKNYLVTIAIFPEGARFTKARHSQQNSPYEYLLKPRSKGISMTLEALEDNVVGILDATILSSKMDMNGMDFFKGSVSYMKVEIEQHLVNKQNVANWLEARWIEKDKKIKNFMQNHQNS